MIDAEVDLIGQILVGMRPLDYEARMRVANYARQYAEDEHDLMIRPIVWMLMRWRVHYGRRSELTARTKREGK